MKRRILAVPVVLVVMGFGIYVGSQTRGPKFIPHTIDYLITNYHEDGTTSTSFLTRTVDANGSWDHVQTMPDGSVKKGRGRMSRLKQVDSTSARDEVLGRAVFIQNTKKDNAALEQFYSLDLQDDLRQVLRDGNGRIMMTQEAVAVR